MITNIALIILSTSLITLSFLYVQLNKKFQEANLYLMKMFLTNSLKLENEIAQQNNQDLDIHKENFIKFLSDSRDWAHEYIESVQKGLKEFIDIADREFAYFDSYGILTQQYPNYEAMKKLSEEYKKLKKLLPEDNQS